MVSSNSRGRRRVNDRFDRVIAIVRYAIVTFSFTAATLVGCGEGADTHAATDAATLHVIAGSELKDIEPYFQQIADATGITLVPTYSGTLVGVDRINAGESFDAAWFANAKYLLLSDAKKRVRAQERIMLSPVVLGVRESVAKRFGWTPDGTTWKAIAARAGAGQFHFAMTNPTASNSGFSAVIAVASALVGAQDALKATDVDTKKLRAFFAGQTVTAGSSGWLIDAYLRDQTKLDGVVNYESSLLALGASGKLREPLVLIYPKEGVLTADYPLLLLDDTKRAAFEKITTYLRTTAFQRLVMEKTFRRPAISGVPLTTAFPHALVNEVSFPNSLAVVDGILGRFLADDRVPAHTFYVLDTSGSMQGERLGGVVRALGTLAGKDPSVTGRYARFQNRERISFISFSDVPRTSVDLVMHATGDAATLGRVVAYANGMHAGGSTAIYCALETALDDAARARRLEGPRYYSIVLMTDGENNGCDDAATFADKYDRLPVDRKIRIFPILFGEAKSSELEAIARISGGRLFNGKTQSLSDVFKEIRGYQ